MYQLRNVIRKFQYQQILRLMCMLLNIISSFYSCPDYHCSSNNCEVYTYNFRVRL